MTRRIWIAALGGALLAGCPGPSPDLAPSVAPEGVRSPFMDPRLEGAPVVLADAPPPISGGTLLVRDGWVIASDPDRDRIVVVDRIARRVHGEAMLPPDAEPGRVVADGAGRAHAVLRGTGEVYSFDPELPASGERRAVCPMPRGVVWEEATDLVHVACRGGELVSLPAAGGAAVRRVQVASDLRDVVIDDGTLLVTRFRTAELLRLDAEGAVVGTLAPGSMIDPFSGTFDRATGAFREAEFHPSVAWRTISMPSGGVAMVHQRASDNELQTAPGAYYSSGLCDGSIVQSAVTFFEGGGTTRTSAPNLAQASLAVDVAVAPDESEVAVVNAGNQSGAGAVVIFPRSDLMFETTCTFATEEVSDVENAIAAAYGADGALVIQQREPARLVIVARADGSRVEIDLGGESRFDTGHAIFHGNASRGTACASCHPEGGEDGRTWVFAGMGPRRTPAMYTGVTETAPFHWDGDLPDLRALSEVVFTGRMSGPTLTAAQVGALGEWMDELPAPVAEARDAEAVARGRALFWGAAQCSACHTGAMLTNNATVDVGTGRAFQVPSLVGVSQRLPVMHDGCATTLRDRFRADCGGGDAHGLTSGLTEPEIDDLVAYLESL